MKACCGEISIRASHGAIHRHGHRTAGCPASEYVDAVILERLAAAADRGVKVRVLCGGRHGISEWDILDTFASLRTLRRFGVKVRKQKNLRVHAKLIVDDNAHALVGSMNIHRSAFDLRRELGTLSDDSAIAERLKEVFDSEWDLSHHDEAPDPLDPSRHPEDDFRTTKTSCMSEIEAGPKKASLIAWPPRGGGRAVRVVPYAVVLIMVAGFFYVRFKEMPRHPGKPLTSSIVEVLRWIHELS